VTVHYHGTPITPLAVLHSLAGRSFCVSWNHPAQVKLCHAIGQSVLLDNGAFNYWSSGLCPDWSEYYRFAEQWLVYHTTWAIIPDVIDGSEDDNDRLIAEWPHGQRGAPVWHMHESIARLIRLADTWSRVCIGSSAQFRTVGSPAWHQRMIEAMNALCGNGPAPVWLHMLRGMQCSEWGYPFASVDSTDIARNHNKGGPTVEGKILRAQEMACRWDARQCPAVWTVRSEQQSLFEVSDVSRDLQNVRL